MKIFKRKTDKFNIQAEKYGVLFKTITATDRKNKVSVCLIRALLIFMCTYGTIGGLVSSFSITYYHAPVIAAFAFVSLYAAFMYYNKFTFYIGYTLYFVVYMVLIIMFYRYINSGYQAFVNIIFEDYKEYFNLNFSRDATELISDRVLTISVTMIAVGTFLALLLNVVISGYMNIIEAFLLTFPILQIGLYIENEPDTVYMIMLLCAYALIGIFHRTGQHRMAHPLNNKNTSFNKTHSRKKQAYVQDPDGKAMGLFTGMFTVFCTLFTLIFFGVFHMDFGTSTSTIKQTSDEYVKEFARTGISGLFNRYRAAGGISNGRLGGISSIRPDYQTDLTVTFVPHSYETVYLCAFSGMTYTSSQWLADPSGIPALHPLTLNASARMRIEREPDVSSTMMPYVTDSLEYTQGGVLEVYYSPYTSLTGYTKNPAITEEYEDYIYFSYLQIPENVMPALDEIISTYILPEEIFTDYLKETGSSVPDVLSPEQKTAIFSKIADETGFINYLNADEEADYNFRLKASAEIINYFNTHFKYTMSPGATPIKADYVTYFLTEQKKGYCSHFASSAVLLLRRLGIPARYSEGYVITLSEMAESLRAEGEQPENWYSGDSLLDTSAVIISDVVDADAHAWVEIYLNGYGFVPLEVTPASSDDEAANTSGFFNLLYNLFTAVDIEEKNFSSDAAVNDDTATSAKSRFDFVFLVKPLIIVISVITVFFIIFRFSDYIIFTIKRYIYLRNGNYTQVIKLYYSKLIKLLNKNGAALKLPCLGRELSGILTKPEICNKVLPGIAATDITSLIETFNRALYSPCACTSEDFEVISGFLDTRYKSTKNNAK